MLFATIDLNPFNCRRLGKKSLTLLGTTKKRKILQSTYISLRVQLDQKLLPLEAQLPDLGPGEGVDFGEVLEDQDSEVGNCEIQRDALVVLEGEREKVRKQSYLL